jgi:hypothetical protein
MTPALTGCLVHRHSVMKTRPPEIVLNATLDQLLKQANERYDAIHSTTAFVQVVACTGGSLVGEIKCYPAFNGNIIIGKPEQIRVILQVPFVGSRALDMVSDGKNFKMLVPPKSCAIVGSDVVTNSSQKGLYSLRPAAVLDSLMIRGFSKDDLVSMTQDSRTYPNPKKRKELIEEPDYDIEFLSQPQGQVAHTLRVLHINRVDLLPYRQDIYNAEGKVATQAVYSNYQKFGKIDFPTRIEIQRPLDQLSLTITVNKRTNFNQKLDPDQFELGPIPENYATQNMDDPASAATAPCVAHETQSPR